MHKITCVNKMILLQLHLSAQNLNVQTHKQIPQLIYHHHFHYPSKFFNYCKLHLISQLLSKKEKISSHHILNIQIKKRTFMDF